MGFKFAWSKIMFNSIYQQLEIFIGTIVTTFKCSKNESYKVKISVKTKFR